MRRSAEISHRAEGMLWVCLPLVADGAESRVSVRNWLPDVRVSQAITHYSCMDTSTAVLTAGGLGVLRFVATILRWHPLHSAVPEGDSADRQERVRTLNG